jgi:signal transduction histidine kinase
MGWQVYAAYLHSFMGPMLHGMAGAAHHRGCNLLLACDMFHSSASLASRAAWPVPSPLTEYIPVGPWNTDGLIVVPPLFYEERSRYIQQVIASGHPVVFFGTGEDGPAIVVDNEGGVDLAISHLVEHGHRRIGFIGGYEESETGDSAIRLAAYHKAIRAHGLEPDPDLIAYGYHTIRGGRDAAQHILDTGAPFTALLTSNDESAIGAMRGLADAGLRVPDDVAVIGFDDILDARAMDPPLTSIHIPKYELGYRVLEYLLDRMSGQAEGAEIVRVPLRLSVRQSCGCSSEATAAPALDSSSEHEAGSEAARLCLAEAAARCLCSEGWHLSQDEALDSCRQLVDALALDLEEGSGRRSRQVLRGALRRTETAGGNPHLWQTVISILEENLAFLVGADDEDGAFWLANRLLHQARVTVSESIRWTYEQYLATRGRGGDEISMMALALRAAPDEKQLFSELAAYLPRIGVERAEMAFYRPQGGDPYGRCRLHAIAGPARESMFFSTKQFPPEGLYPEEEPFSKVLLPLIIQDELQGFAVFDTADLDSCANIVRQIVVEYERRQAQERLENQAEELARSNVELERFAYVASHDLQEPLRMVTSFLQLLERRYGGQIDADADEFIGYAIGGATRMKTLVKDLLAYSRVGRHGQPLVRVDCTAILEQALANLILVIDEYGATVTHDRLPTVMADEAQMVQVFQNLIGNALKFHSERPPEIHVGAEHDDGAWVLSVRDNGIGIEKEYFDRIFVAFQRLHDQTRYPGTGIGLAICKRIIERHGGEIWVESEPGQGSTFFFTIMDGEGGYSR